MSHRDRGIWYKFIGSLTTRSKLKTCLLTKKHVKVDYCATHYGNTDEQNHIATKLKDTYSNIQRIGSLFSALPPSNKYDNGLFEDDEQEELDMASIHVRKRREHH